ncbi:hypothetical protein [Noviluteimonas gilva]|nr:hypothetical protein [Lysobacter gilvus]
MALALCCATASAQTQTQAPANFEGQPVQTLTATLRGTTFSLHATDSGYIPESTDRLTFDNAGPEMEKATGDRGPRYRWGFGFALKGDAKPVRVRVEDFGKDADTLLVDDTAPVIDAGHRWSGRAATECDIVPTAPCAAWIFDKGLQTLIFRLTVDFDDGTNQVLYQGAAFNPDTMQPVWSFLGVKR